MENLLDKVPPDFALAKKHGNANLIKNFGEFNQERMNTDDESNMCECCLMPTTKVVPRFKLCTSIRSLEALGAGFPLFYSFKKFAAISFFTLFAFIGLLSTIINLSVHKSDEWIEGGGAPYVV